VSGSELYKKIQIEISPLLPKPHWHSLKAQCAGKISTLVELLKDKLSQVVMELVTGREEHGLFPKPKEIQMRCSCPDGAFMCKHTSPRCCTATAWAIASIRRRSSCCSSSGA
jgi:uncharacterized Zn finger protein